MCPTKFVLKCGNFAVLVDLHVLPPGLGEEASWFTEQHKEEVCQMIRDAVDQRVRHFLETSHQRGQPKQRKGSASASPVCVKGERIRLAAYFMKRHVNLRCVGPRRRGELRVFPERLVVCASVPADAAERGGGGGGGGEEADLTAMEHSKSEYFAGHHETQDPLNSSAITKRITLQKIAKKASAQAHPCPRVPGGRDQQGAPPLSVAMETEAGGGASNEELGDGAEEGEMGGEDGGSGAQTSAGAPRPEGAPIRNGPRGERPGPAPRQGCRAPGGELAEPPQAELGEGRGGRARLLEEGQRAKRACSGQAPASPSQVITKTRSAESSSPPATSPPLAVRSPPSPGPVPGPALGQGPTQQKPSSKPLLRRNGPQASQGGQAGSDGDASSQHSEIKPSDAGRGAENLPRKSRLKRIKKT
ncbi:protein SLX4IP [Anguilla rostrata]|uniref:protein SLX4IP n=1 Tax=Anguilla rostrata TaxID=7938 RepID=UPI0030CA63E3